MKRSSRSFGLFDLVEANAESEVYKFGDDGLKTSTKKITMPVIVGGQPCRLPASVIPGIKLPLLIGRDFLSEADAQLSMREPGKLSINGKSQVLHLSRAEHFACPLQLEKYKKLTEGCKDMPQKRDRGAPRTFRVSWCHG